METTITYNDLPKVMTLILSKLDALEDAVSKLEKFAPEEKTVWLNVSELCAYLPSHPREQTVYSWTCTRKIPFHKKGRSIMFNRAEIDHWLQNGSHFLSEQDLSEEAERFIEKKKRNKY